MAIIQTITRENFAEKVQQAYILPRIMGSDHCPVGLQLDVT